MQAAEVEVVAAEAAVAAATVQVVTAEIVTGQVATVQAAPATAQAVAPSDLLYRFVHCCRQRGCLGSKSLYALALGQP